MIGKMVRVICICNESVPKHVLEILADIADTRLYASVELKTDLEEPDEQIVREWLADHGVMWSGKDDYEYVLFQI